MKRMDRYEDSSTTKMSRSSNNKELYQDIYNNPKYTSITDVTNSNAYEISSQNNDKKTRESYQQMKKYQNVENTPKVKKELDDFNHLYHMDEKKVYDINSVLEEARKNKAKDDLEEKRKLKYTSYNILAGINLEELQKYREEKKKRQATPEEEGMRELIDTIASKTLAGELDKEETVDLLCDLMATSAMDTVASSKDLGKDIDIDDIEFGNGEEEASEPKILEVEEETEDDEDDEKDISDTTNVDEELIKKIYDNVDEEMESEPESTVDKDFYTKSMDLSEQDFDMSDDFKEKKLPWFIKMIIYLLVIVLVFVTAYFIYQKIV